MKWYKHDANAHGDAKLERVMIKYGMEGYGLYWYCLELISQTVEPHNLNFELEHDAEIISHRTGIHYERVQEMMTFMVDLGLFEQSNGVITCLKLAKRCDEYTSKLIRNLPCVGTNSGHTPDKVPPIRRDKKRTDKNIIEHKKGAKDAPPDVDGLNLEAWEMWIDYRRKAHIRKYTTDLKAKELAKLSHDDQLSCVEYSISNQYTGLFPDRIQAKKPQSFAEKLAADMRDKGML